MSANNIRQTSVTQQTDVGAAATAACLLSHKPEFRCGSLEQVGLDVMDVMLQRTWTQ